MIGKKTKRVGKLLLQTSVRELHNDLIKSEKLGGLPTVWTWDKKKLLVSDTALRYLMARQVKNLLKDINKCVDATSVFTSSNCKVP